MTKPSYPDGLPYSLLLNRMGCRYWKTLNVVLNEGSKVCTLGIVNSAKTKSLEHKVKVRAQNSMGNIFFVHLCEHVDLIAGPKQGWICNLAAGVINNDIRRAAVHRNLELMHRLPLSRIKATSLAFSTCCSAQTLLPIMMPSTVLFVMFSSRYDGTFVQLVALHAICGPASVIRVCL